MQRPFKAKKSLGQNFLTNPRIAERIAHSIAISSGETVFEVGPGTGRLTRTLLKAGAHVVALEADMRAIEVLRESFAKEIVAKKLTLLHGDIRKIEVSKLPLPRNYKVAANIPYYLSGYLFEKLLSCDHQPKSLVFLVQKEVAERIARSKKESLLSLSVKVYGTPLFVGTVSRGNFSPQPNVDSAILSISDISKEHFAGLTEEHFFTVLKTGFKARRKLLLGNLTTLSTREKLVNIFSELKIKPSVRGEDLPIGTWLKLARALA